MNAATLFRSTCLLALACGVSVGAKVSQAEADRLGKDLTPYGAEKAGNREGTIPEWTGEPTPIPSSYRPGGHRPNPYPEDKPLFVITASNVDQYKDKLTEGQIAMFAKYPETWKMPVYKTRRNTTFPDYVYEWAKKNALNAELAENGNGVTGAGVTVAFPIPKSGVECIWNHALRFIPKYFANTTGIAALTASGSYTLYKSETNGIRQYAVLGIENMDMNDDQLFDFYIKTIAPAFAAGGVTLVKDWADSNARPRQAWQYSTGTRRVRRAPNIAFDTPISTSDGQAVVDENFAWNGSPERYNWKLIGKKEVYIPYNEYDLSYTNVKYETLLTPGHINPDYRRYELHRVWVVEATLKEGFSHIYARRLFFLDEDSWLIAHQDQYDSRDALWRVHESPLRNFYDVPGVVGGMDLVYDLSNGRYYASGLINEDQAWDFVTPRNPNDYNAAALRRGGKR